MRSSIKTFILPLVLFVFVRDLGAECLRYRGICQADWMAQLPQSVQQRRFDQIKLLGTHDSGADQLNLNASIPMEQTPILDWFKDLAEIDPIADQVLENLTLSQPLSVFEQLEQGIRALDLRILYNNRTRDFYLSHSFASKKLFPVLCEIAYFLYQHPAELLVISVADDDEHVEQTSPYNSQVSMMIQEVIGNFLIPVSATQTITDNMTLHNLVAQNQRVLVNFKNYFWPAAVLVQYWPNGQTVNQSMQVIETYLPKLNISKPILNLVFFTVTPDAESILKRLIVDWSGKNYPDSLFDWAAKIYPLAVHWIGSNVQKLGGLNIISADAPSDEYVQWAIDLNR